MLLTNIATRQEITVQDTHQRMKEPTLYIYIYTHTHIKLVRHNIRRSF